jgi:predicted transcriptional regulator
MPTRKKAAQAPPSGLSRDVKTRIDEDLYRRVIERARRDDRSESSVVRQALRQFLAAEDGEATA